MSPTTIVHAIQVELANFLDNKVTFPHAITRWSIRLREKTINMVDRFPEFQEVRKVLWDPLEEALETSRGGRGHGRALRLRYRVDLQLLSTLPCCRGSPRISSSTNLQRELIEVVWAI